VPTLWTAYIVVALVFGYRMGYGRGSGCGSSGGGGVVSVTSKFKSKLFAFLSLATTDYILVIYRV